MTSEYRIITKTEYDLEAAYFESEDFQETKDTSERFAQIGAQFSENWVLQVQ